MKSLANRLLNNPGLLNLTTPEEQAEIKVVAFGSPHSGEALMKAGELRGRKIVFAFFQDDFKGGKIPYWHVCIPTHKSYQSTLSMQGLRDWGVL